MIVLACVVIGVILGIRAAGRHGGQRADKVQYAIACGIAGALLGLIATVVVENLIA
jgi:hypothetical protein